MKCVHYMITKTMRPVQSSKIPFKDSVHFVTGLSVDALEWHINAQGPNVKYSSPVSLNQFTQVLSNYLENILAMSAIYVVKNLDRDKEVCIGAPDPTGSRERRAHVGVRRVNVRIRRVHTRGSDV